MKTAISEEEYLATSFEWEPEYRDGEIIERPTPNTKHSTAQTFTGSAFLPLRSRFPLTVASDLRVRLRPGFTG